MTVEFTFNGFLVGIDCCLGMFCVDQGSLELTVISACAATPDFFRGFCKIIPNI